jgi:hypothetical protein
MSSSNMATLILPFSVTKYLHKSRRNLAKILRAQRWIITYLILPCCLMMGAKAVDLFSIATCEVSEAGSSLAVKGERSTSLFDRGTPTASPQAAECVSEQGKARCSSIGGTCITERDGYYITTGLCLGLGVIVLVAFIIPTARKLQGELL